MMTAPAPVSVIAQASSSGKPKRCLERRVEALVDAGAEAEAHACAALSEGPSGADISMAGMTPR